MSALLPTPSDFAGRTLSLERASQLFPSLGVSIIESRSRAPIQFGSDFPNWTGSPDTLLAACGTVFYETHTGEVEVSVNRGVPIYHRERLYRIALGAATSGPDTKADNWSVIEGRHSTGTWLGCRWCGRLNDTEVADELVAELLGADEEKAR